MAKTKVVEKKHKSTKHEVKKSKATVSTAEASEGTQEILSLAKKMLGGGHKEHNGVIRVYRDKACEMPLLRITGITKDVPNVEIKPKLRETVENGKQPPEAFTEKTGLKVRKVWKSVFNGSNYIYKGEPQKLQERLRIYFKHVKANSEA